MINRKRYGNLDGVPTTKSLQDMIKWQKERRAKLPDMSYVVLQSADKRQDYLHNNRNDTTITWIGHSTYLIQYKGLNIPTVVGPRRAFHNAKTKRL